MVYHWALVPDTECFEALKESFIEGRPPTLDDCCTMFAKKKIADAIRELGDIPLIVSLSASGFRTRPLPRIFDALTDILVYTFFIKRIPEGDREYDLSEYFFSEVVKNDDAMKIIYFLIENSQEIAEFVIEQIDIFAAMFVYDIFLSAYHVTKDQNLLSACAYLRLHGINRISNPVNRDPDSFKLTYNPEGDYA